MIRTDHPRPLLTRDHWQDLSGPWGFATDPEDRGLQGGWQNDDTPYDRTITVPYPPESELSGIGERSCPDVVWYRREVRVERAPQEGERLTLHFGAVDYRARIWMNGVYLGGHEGGHTPFSFDVTEALTHGDDQVLVVRAEDRMDDGAQPRGKQAWKTDPHGVWYHRTTGIWQPVWLETVPELHLTRLDWTPEVPAATVTLDAALSALPSPDTRLRVSLFHGGELLAEQTVRPLRDHVSTTLELPAGQHQLEKGRLLWSPESPTLLEARVELLQGTQPIDLVGSYTGLRSVSIKDGRLLLNGQPRFLRLVLAQNYWPESHLAAPSPEALRREVELAKELGFNGIRIHQKIEDPRFLAWCDQLGMMVWSEMPSAYEYRPAGIEQLTREWMENVARDRSHPCVITWVPFNESWGVWNGVEVAEQRHATEALYHLTKALDGTRPVISNDGWEHTESDIWGLHDYAPTGESIRRRYADQAAVDRVLSDRPPARRTALLGDPAYRGQPVMLTEIGGLSIRPRAGEAWHGYATVKDPQQLQEQFASIIDAVLDSAEIAGLCWTQLTDTEQESNGLLTADREPKLPVEEVRRILTRPAVSAPAEAIDAARRAARD